MIRKFLRKIDMYGQPVSLKFNGHSKHQSEVGGIASITTFIIVFLFFSSNIMSFIEKGELNVTVINDFEEEPELINLQKSVRLAVGFDDVLALTQFNISLQQMQNFLLKPRIIQNRQIVNRTNIVLEPCQSNEFNSNYMCIKYNSVYISPNQDFLLGEMNQKKYQVHLTVSKCNTCVSENTSQLLQLVFLNQVINPMDASENYIQTFLDDTFSIRFTPQTFSKEQEILITQYDLHNDDSLFYTDIHESQAFSVDQRDCSQTVNADSEIYASFIFKKNRVKVTINRSYQKLTDLLSRLGGFLKISFFILGFAFQIYNRLQLYLLLSNKVYEFSFKSIQERNNYEQQFEVLNTALQNRMTKTNGLMNDEGTRQKLPESHIKSRKHTIHLHPRSANQINFSYLPNETKRQHTEEDLALSGNLLDNHESLAKKFNCETGLEYFQKQISIIINRSQPLRLTFKIFLNQVCCSKLFKSDIHVKLYQKSIKEISEHLDVYYILQKLEELNKLKSILLTTQQLCVFNFAPKKLIAPDNCELRFNRNFLEEKARTRYNLTYNSESTIQIPKRKSQESENLIYERIYNAYDQILNKEEQPSDVNKQIINKLGVELQTIFKVSKLIDFSQLQHRTSRRIIRRNAQTNNEIQTTKMMQQFYQI